MSVKEVTLLRKSGRLKEAHEMAVKELAMDRDNPWCQMSLFWVLRAMCMEPFVEEDKARIYLKNMAALLPTMMDESGAGENAYRILFKKYQKGAEEITKASILSKTDPISAYRQIAGFIELPIKVDSVTHEDLGWIIFRYIKASDNITDADMVGLLRSYLALKVERPSMLHSQMLNLALKHARISSDFSLYDFFMDWGPQFFRAEDLKDNMYDGKVIRSLISRVLTQLVNEGETLDVQALSESCGLNHEILLDMIREPQFWHIYNLCKENKKQTAYEAFGRYNEQNASLGPSHWNSEVLKLAERFMVEEESWRFVCFFKAWHIDNLMQKDWEPEKDEEGHEFKPLALKVAKRCFETLNGRKIKDEKSLEWLSDFYDTVLSHQPDDEWLQRQRAIIFIWQGQQERAVDIFKSLLLKLGDKYYIWSELAHCLNDKQLKLAMFCKALLLERKEDFIGSIRLDLAELLIDGGLYAEAQFELDRYFKNHENLSPRYTSLKESLATDVKASRSNQNFYEQYAPLAEQYAYSDIDAIEVTMVSRWKDDGKVQYSFTDGADISFTTNDRRFPLLKKAVLGMLFKVKFSRPDGRYLPLVLEKLDRDLWSGLDEMFGYVEYLNEEKKVLHLMTQNSELLFCPFAENWGCVKKGDFVSFRQYSTMKKEEKRTHAVDVKKVDKKTALAVFPEGIVTVDDVNFQKGLLHFTFGEGKIGGTLHIERTDRHYEPGQNLKVRYYIKKDIKYGKRALALQAEETDEINPIALKQVRGSLSVTYRDGIGSGMPAFGFVEDCYVHRTLLEKSGITEDCEVSGEAVYAGEGKWKIIRLERL